MEIERQTAPSRKFTRHTVGQKQVVFPIFHTTTAGFRIATHVASPNNILTNKLFKDYIVLCVLPTVVDFHQPTGTANASV